MKVLVCGSRSWTNAETIRRRLAKFPRGTEIIHGNARGADKLAAIVANGLGFTVTAFPAQWNPAGRYDPKAGFKRNNRMLDENPDLVLAFWDGRSTGTAHTLSEAVRRDIPFEVVKPWAGEA